MNAAAYRGSSPASGGAITHPPPASGGATANNSPSPFMGTSVEFSKQPLLWLFCNAERSKRICPAFAVTVATVVLTVAENSRVSG